MGDKTCKNCRWWKRGENIRYTGEYMDPDRKRVVTPSTHGKCDSDKFVYAGRENDSETDSLWYEDYESYAAGFDTGEDFGCIHWSDNG